MSNLATRTGMGFFQLVAVLALALFAPAWTLGFWQAWAYLAVFTAASASITAYLWKFDRNLLERRLDAGPAAERRLPQMLIQAAAGAAFIGLFVVSSLDHRFAWSRVPVAIVIAGNVLSALGFWIIFRVFKENSFAAATIGVADGQTVVATGPYAIVRHPMYSGALVLLMATPLALGSWWALLLFIPMALVIVARLLDEETFLSTALAGYDDYRREVRHRLAPGIW